MTLLKSVSEMTDEELMEAFQRLHSLIYQSGFFTEGDLRRYRDISSELENRGIEPFIAETRGIQNTARAGG